ncbi:hypothetical protein [Undibacterium danionis]|uniref:Large polyvalent protein-associated domain-containing protein n=1 Tax=Undibacterium danionis TaxID=1812100 RepID=A0ABV6ICN0_9BURK
MLRHQRVILLGMDINADKAFFPRGRRGSPGYIGDAAALYPQNDYMNQANVHLYKNGAVVNGWNEAGAVAIVNGATQTRDKGWSLLRHEVQHDMDQHLGRDAMADGRSFRRAIADYYEPDTEGFNKFNSRHVDAFYRALDAVGNKDVRRGLEVSHNIEIAPVAAGARVSNTQDAAVEALLQVIAGLTIADASYIFEQCPSMRAKIDRHLEGAARNRVLEDLEWASS